MRKLRYVQAINETFHQVMARDENVLLIGQGVTSPWYVGATTTGLEQRFGPGRVIDTPVSESAVTGMAAGASLAGMRCVVVHPRMDFMFYAMDQIINHAANWHYMFGGQLSVPLTIWGIVNRGGEQAAQHSQALQAMFAHVPGLKVVMPSTPHDAKGLLAAAIEDDNPVLFVDDRWLYDLEGDVPEELYGEPIGKAVVRKEGRDVTLAATSYLACQAMAVAEQLEEEGISVEVIDLRALKPLDEETLLASVAKTGRLAVADGGWKSYGAGAEVAAVMAEKGFRSLRAPVARIALPDTPAPASRTLEHAYYPDVGRIAREIKKLVKESIA